MILQKNVYNNYYGGTLAEMAMTNKTTITIKLYTIKNIQKQTVRNKTKSQFLIIPNAVH